MKRLFHRLRKKGKSAFCVLLAAVLVTSVLSAAVLPITARGEERVFDIGVNAESVTATLSEDGVLTVSGSGAIRDFTPETAPFAHVSVTSLILGKDVTAIGSYTFYNCGDLTGELELPAGLVRIGDRAFSGGSRAKAPRFTFVTNAFTQQMVTRKREDAAPAPTPTPTAAPAPAASSAAAPAASGEDLTEAEELASPAESAEPEEESAAGEPAEQGAGAVSSEPTETAESAVEITPEPVTAPEVSSQPAETAQSDSKFMIETITQQEIGEEIFYPRTDSPAFTCSSENYSFRAAMKTAGYVEADRLLTVAFDCGEGTAAEETVVTRDLPLVDGKLLLPGLLQEFSGPEEQGLYAYRFSGWTESQDQPDQVREPGSAYEPGDREDLYFIAGWDRQVRLKINVQWEDGDVLLSVPRAEGYALTGFRWQSCVPGGEELPEDLEQWGWEEISGAEGPDYRVENPDEDDPRLFRCLVTARKEVSFLKRLFAAPAKGEELTLSPVRIRKAAAAVDGALVLDPGEGTVPGGVATQIAVQWDGRAVVPECGFTAPGSDVVFCGWTDGTNHYDPGDRVSGGTVLRAKWKAPVKSVSVTAAEDLLAQMAGAEVTEVPEEALYLNVITISGTLSLSADQTVLPVAENANACTVTGGVLESGEPVSLQMDVRFTGITLSFSELAARGHRCVLGAGTVMTGTVYGGEALNGNSDLRIFSGDLTAVYGGGKTAGVPAGTSVFIGGNARAGAVYGGGQSADSAVSRGTSVTIAQNAAVTGNVYGGGQEGAVSGGAQVFLLGGTVDGGVFGGGDLAGATVDGGTSVTVSGGSANDVYGGGNQGEVSGSASVTVAESAGISGSVYGGGKAASVGGTGAEHQVKIADSSVAGDVYGGGDGGDMTGSASVEITDSALGAGVSGGSVYGGGKNGDLADGSATVALSGGTVRGSVYGGGENGSLTDGSATVTLTGGVSVLGSVYGGGDGGSVESASVTLEDGVLESDLFGGGALGAVAGTTRVTVTGGQVKGRVFGGGQGYQESDDSYTVQERMDFGRVAGPVTVTVSGGAVDGGVYGGGEMGPVGVGTDAEDENASTAAQTTVNISGGSVSCVYGGGAGTGSGSYGAVFGKTVVTVSGGTVTNDVFGGGGRAHVTGHTQVDVKGTAAVGRSVFGGGNLGESAGNEFTDQFLVHGGSAVTLDGKDGASVAGDVCCSGNLTRVEPQSDRILTIRNFDGLTLGSIQRTASALIQDSSVTLTGGSDQRSLTQIWDLTLTRSTLALEAGVRDLRALTNGDAGQPSTLRVSPGLFIRVARSENGENVYGKVEGVFQLEMISGSGSLGQGDGVRIQASPTESSVGDQESDTGSFVKGAGMSGIDLVSGTVAGVYNYWQLGDPVTRLDVTLTASHHKEGGFQIDGPLTESLNINGSGSTLKVVKVEKVSGDFHLVQPTETDGEITGLTPPQCGTAEDTYALRIQPVGDNWSNLARSGQGVYLVTQPEDGFVRRGEEAPVSLASGDGALQISLLYDASGKLFEEGEIRVTLEEETEDGQPLGTAVLCLNIAGDKNITSQSSAIAAGRRFTDSLTGDSAEITAKGAVTALFTSRFFPSGAGALRLYTLEEGQPAAAAFPAGTRVILGDVSGSLSEGEKTYRYYYYQCPSAMEEIGLSLPGNPGAGPKNYAGFADEGVLASERLLFTVDFSGASENLSAGTTYYLALVHRDGEDWEELAPAAFTISGEGAYKLELEKSGDSTDQVWRMQAKTAVAEKDTRYADGASIQLTLVRKAAKAGESDEAVSFPDNIQVEINDQESGVLRDRSGDIYCSLPAGSASASITFRFVNVPASAFADGSFELQGVMRPRVGLQIGSDGAGSGVEGVTSNTLAFDLARETAVAQRSVSVTIDGKKRLVDASQEARQLEFSLAYNVQEGDTLAAEVLVKTRTDSPASSSYAPVDNAAQWTVTLPTSLGSGDGSGALTVTVPKGQAAGTYRILVRVLDSEGSRMTEEPCNIIVQ